MQHKIQQIQSWMAESRHTVFFGGAGVSTESHIPDFRSNHGLYQQSKYPHPAETMLSHSFYCHHPQDFYQFYFQEMIYPDALPNEAHQALADMEENGLLECVITQNIDGLHQSAGSKKVLELHGSIHRNYCQVCGGFYDVKAMLQQREGIPYCFCGGVIKPDVVLYEEGLDMLTLQLAIAAVERAELLIVGGTSLQVYPAAGLLEYFQGKHLVLINKDETPFDIKADLVIHDSIGHILKEVLHGMVMPT